MAIIDLFKDVPFGNTFRDAQSVPPKRNYGSALNLTDEGLAPTQRASQVRSCLVFAHRVPLICGYRFEASSTSETTCQLIHADSFKLFHVRIGLAEHPCPAMLLFPVLNIQSTEFGEQVSSDFTVRVHAACILYSYLSIGSINNQLVAHPAPIGEDGLVKLTSFHPSATLSLPRVSLPQLPCSPQPRVRIVPTALFAITCSLPAQNFSTSGEIRVGQLLVVISPPTKQLSSSQKYVDASPACADGLPADHCSWR